MNFLHFAVLLFAICSFVLVAVSMMTGRPEQHKLDGLTFAYADQGSGSELGPQQWRKSNAIASLILLATVFALWTIFF